jgi:hypothetical protein
VYPGARPLRRFYLLRRLEAQGKETGHVYCARAPGRNQVLFREVNERIRQVLDDWPERGEFLCECSNEDCMETIYLTLEEYEAVRERAPSSSSRGHELGRIERVVGETDTYKLVETIHGAGCATEMDPRSRPEGQS